MLWVVRVGKDFMKVEMMRRGTLMAESEGGDLCRFVFLSNGRTGTCRWHKTGMKIPKVLKQKPVWYIQ